MTKTLSTVATELAALLESHRSRVVFAESCTAGLVSATLAQVPGISQWLCGSAVTYREATKTAWLDVPDATIQQHNVVSAEVAQAMALGVLQLTPEADLAASITGHLGPDAPADLDGIAPIAIARRGETGPSLLTMKRCELESTDRSQRQREATAAVLRLVASCLE